MRIGIDLDGVVFDTEKDLRIYSELYDMFELKQNGKKDNKEIRITSRLGWTEEQLIEFLRKYHAKIVKESNYMPGAKLILNKLKEEGHELIVITARGGYDPEIIEISKERFKQDGMDIFDKYCFRAEEKGVVCQKENIDIMIDDSNEKCEMTSKNKIKTIYLKDAPSYDMEENEYLKVLYNWGEIYRYIKEIQK